MSIVKGFCPECRMEHLELHIWANSTMDYVHGNYEQICRRCTVVRQLLHAREMAAKLPELEALLAEIDKS